MTSPLARLPALIAAALLAFAGDAPAAPTVRQGSSADAVGLQAIVNTFRNDLGGANNGVGGSFPDGRRELNWDGVPDSFAAPNNFPPDFFNVTSPRGVVFHTVLEDSGSALNQFVVSASAASGVPVRFGDINPSYGSEFITFSAQRLFMARGAHALLVKFYRPGTMIEATVNGFGAVFADIDNASGGSRSSISAYSPDGRQLAAANAPASDGGLSFVGISFADGERIGYVIIRAGTRALAANTMDGAGAEDIVALDDFIYGEPAPVSGCVFADGFECELP
jgi:hypothetical protein